MTRHKSSHFVRGIKTCSRGGRQNCALVTEDDPSPWVMPPINSTTLAVTDAGWSAIKRGSYLGRHSKSSDGVLMRSAWHSRRQTRAHLTLPFQPLNPAAVLQIASVLGFSSEEHQSKVRENKTKQTKKNLERSHVNYS